MRIENPLMFWDGRTNTFRSILVRPDPEESPLLESPLLDSPLLESPSSSSVSSLLSSSPSPSSSSSPSLLSEFPSPATLFFSLGLPTGIATTGPLLPSLRGCASFSCNSRAIAACFAPAISASSPSLDSSASTMSCTESLSLGFLRNWLRLYSTKLSTAGTVFLTSCSLMRYSSRTVLSRTTHSSAINPQSTTVPLNSRNEVRHTTSHPSIVSSAGTWAVSSAATWAETPALSSADQ
mmetsp:Transcript_2977/g.6906  ORF Transcript_2977/g.6906 Transcript_2977/m.6906 type:complete len:237 (+) Transcript_2977:3440-4150(+)